MDTLEINQRLISSLPPVLKAVVMALGLGRARVFLIEHGGVNINIPKFRVDNSLGLNENELASMNKYLECHMNENGRLWLPKVDKLFIFERNIQIIKDKSNLSIHGLAKKYNLSSKQIMNICRLAEC